MAAAVDSFPFLFEQISRDTLVINDAITIVGLYYAGKITISLSWSIFQAFRTHVLSNFWQTCNFSKHYGQWAIVTGCNCGIGKAYTAELAMRGMNIALIGHTSHYLDEIATELEQSYHIETMVIEVDFSKGSSVYDLISQAITNLDVGILVNGVSVISTRPVYLIEIDQSALWEYLNVNIASVTLMTRIVLPSMLKNRRGAIVNISSLAGYFPTPLLAVYSASKTYVKHFSLALAEECRGSGVSIQTLTPSFLKSTSMSKNNFWETDNFLFPSAEVFARHAVNTLGISSHTTGYWLHGLQSWIMSCLPLWAYMRLSGITNNLLRKHYVSGSTGRLNPIHIHQE